MIGTLIHAAGRPAAGWSIKSRQIWFHKSYCAWKYRHASNQWTPTCQTVQISNIRKNNHWCYLFSKREPSSGLRGCEWNMIVRYDSVLWSRANNPCHYTLIQMLLHLSRCTRHPFFFGRESCPRQTSVKRPDRTAQTDETSRRVTKSALTSVFVSGLQCYCSLVQSHAPSGLFSASVGSFQKDLKTPLYTTCYQTADRHT